MGGLFNIINVPLGYVMRFLANIFGGDFAAAVAVFTLLINLVLIPLSIKGQKSAVSQMRIKPKMDELKKRYGSDRRKMAEEQQKLYQEEGVSMSGGCLPMLVRLLLMMSIYSLILSPLTYMANAGKSEVNPNLNRTDYIYNTVRDNLDINTRIETAKKDLAAAKENPEKATKSIEQLEFDVAHLESKKEQYETAAADLKTLGWVGTQRELEIVDVVINKHEQFKEKVPSEIYALVEKDVDFIIENNKENPINYKLFGIEELNLTQKPGFSWNIFSDAKLLWIIPLGSFAAQILTSIITMRINKKNNPDAPSMIGMTVVMSFISLFIGFSLPGGVGFYWICSSLIGGLVQAGVQLWYGPNKLLAHERAKDLLKQCDFETNQINKFANKSDDDNSDNIDKTMIKD